MIAPDLLPPVATAFERAVDAVDQLRHAQPVELLPASFDPATCPAPLLGYLAFHLSIDLWDEAWPEAKKRLVCANAIPLHRSKTTLAGIAAHVALVGSEVRGAVRPPASGFWKSAITAEARAAYLAALPQVRLYPFSHHGIARRRWFLSSRAARRGWQGSNLARAWLRTSRGDDLLGTRASFWQAGVDRTIDVVEADGAVTALLPAIRPNRSWHGHHFGWLRASRALADIVAFRPDPAAAAYALSRGAPPVAIAPVRIFPRRIAPRHRSFFGRPLRYLQPSAAPRLVYDRFSVADKSISIARRPVRAWHGHGRYGIAPYTAELSIVVPMRRPRLTFNRWHGRGFTRTADFTPVARTIEAVRAAKAARDTILIDTASHAPAAFAPGLVFGDFTFGTRMRKF